MTVAREGRWWMIRVDGLDGYRTHDGAINVGDTTQARRYAEIEQQARDYVCTVTDSKPSEVDLHITVEHG